MPPSAGQAFLDGRPYDSEGPRFALVNPATEQEIDTSVTCSAADVSLAVSAARHAFDHGPWPRMTLDERIEALRATLRAVAAEQERFAQLQTAQMGAPITVSRMLAGSVSELLDAYIDGARGISYDYLRRDSGGTALIRQRPVGVVAVILPWNGPLSALVSTCVPALLAGCTVVLKPAPETPLEAGLFARLASDAGLPDGVLNVITGGAPTGEALVSAPGVDRVNFTGSTAAGQRVGAVCGARLTRLGLELGGKSAAIILPDADLEATLPAVAGANFFNSGQICVALTRVLVPETLHASVVDGLCQIAAQQVLGDPLDEATTLGPLVSSRQRDQVEAHIAAGRAAGATVAFGGGRPPHLQRGWFVEPTVVTGVDNDMSIAREEIFGPVVSVIQYRDEAEAVRIANDSRYGLHGAVFGRDVERALAVAESIHSGSVAVNGAGLTPGTPYGGVKGSGLGRQHGREGLATLLECHSYVIPESLAYDLRGRGLEFA